MLQQSLSMQVQEMEFQTASRLPDDFSNVAAIILDKANPPAEFADGSQLLRKIFNKGDVPVMYLVERTHSLAHLSPIQRINYVKKPVVQRQLQKSLLEVLSVIDLELDEPNQPSPITEGIYGNAKPRILVVEDNPINQKIALLMLEKLGCNVDVAANGVEALKSLQLFNYDLIFMDCQMPEMDGFEATRRIRKLPKPVSDIPIVALTANAFKEDQARCVESGMNDFVTKPVEPATLESKLRQHIVSLSPPASVPRTSSEFVDLGL